MSDIEHTIRSIIADKLNVSPQKITDQALFVEDLGADSLDTVELVMALEEEFNIEIPDDVAENIHNFSDVVKLIRARTTIAS